MREVEEQTLQERIAALRIPNIGVAHATNDAYNRALRDVLELIAEERLNTIRWQRPDTTEILECTEITDARLASRLAAAVRNYGGVRVVEMRRVSTVSIPESAREGERPQ